jgi:WD40 repeat protein
MNGDREPAWDDADDAMHQLLLAAFSGPIAAGAGSVAASWDLKIGESIGRFRIEGVLGRGGFGVVYRATDARLRRTVALKVPRADRVQTAALWDRLALEARLAATLDHEAIVPVLDAGMIDGLPVLVTAYQPGESLSRWLADRHPAGAPPRLAADLALRMADGLAHAHERGVLHRDLKPSNVLVVPAPGPAEGWAPRITDFGLGTFHEEAEAGTITGFWQGSPPYMAPEQVLPDLGRVDARADIYALGAILYELLTGRPIYPCSSLVELSVLLGRGEPPRRPRPGLPRDLETIAWKCLERRPGARYASAGALRDDLRRFLDRRPILARSISPAGRLARWARRRPSLAALACLGSAAALLTVGLLARHDRQMAVKNAELSRGNFDLRRALAERDTANRDLQSTLGRLQSTERTRARIAYAADLRLAERELAAGRVERAQTILRRHEAAASPRDFAWKHLTRQAMRAYTVLPLKDFRWWRGETPLRETFERLDGQARDRLVNHLQHAQINRREIRSLDGPSPFVLGANFHSLRAIPAGPGGSMRLEFDDGAIRTPTTLTGRPYVFGPGGRRLFACQDLSHPQAAAPIFPVDLGSVVVMVRPSSEASVAARPEEIPVTDLPIIDVRTSFSDDGTILGGLGVIGADPPTIVCPRLYDLSSGWSASYPDYRVHFRQTNPLEKAGETILPRLVLSPDGRLAALTGESPRLRVFEVRTGRTLWAAGADSFGADLLATCAAFDGPGGVLATGDNSGRVRAWNATTGQPLGEFPGSLDGPIENVFFHPDDQTVAFFGRHEDAIRFWDLAPGPDPPTLLDHGDEVWGLAFTPDGRSLLSAGDDGIVRAFDPATGGATVFHQGPVLWTSLAIDPTGTRVAVGDYDGRLSVLRTDPAGSPTATIDALPGTTVRAVAFSPTGPPLVVACGKGPGLFVGAVDAEGRLADPRTVPRGEPSDYYGLVFSPDGRTLAAGSHSWFIDLWDVPSFRPRSRLPAIAGVSCLAISPDGRTLVSGDLEGRLQFWDLPAGRLRATVPRASEKGGVWSLAFSPDSQALASGGDDQMVRLWDPELAIERLSLPGHESKVHALAFSPDGGLLASGDFLGKIRLWQAGRLRPSAGGPRSR